MIKVDDDDDDDEEAERVLTISASDPGVRSKLSDWAPVKKKKKPSHLTDGVKMMLCMRH